MNWKRPTKTVKVKKHPKGIVVDKCCAPFVRKIDRLKDTMATWCCCNHGRFLRDGIAVGGVEFISKLPLQELVRLLKPKRPEKIITRKYIGTKEEKKEGYNGFIYEHKCLCVTKVKENAKKHFKK